MPIRNLLNTDFCHELDHLEGILFTEKASRMLTPEELQELGVTEED